MPYSVNFLEIPLLQDLITEVCTAFAQEKSADAISFYHDSPLWIVRQEDEAGMHREVQISAQQFESSEPELYFIAYLLKLVSPSRFRVKSSGSDFKVSCREIESFRERTKRLIIRSFLEDAWEAALSWTEADLEVGVDLPAPFPVHVDKVDKKKKRRL